MALCIYSIAFKKGLGRLLEAIGSPDIIDFKDLWGLGRDDRNDREHLVAFAFQPSAVNLVPNKREAVQVRGNFSSHNKYE